MRGTATTFVFLTSFAVVCAATFHCGTTTSPVGAINSRTCAPVGSTSKASDGCNTCTCAPDNRWNCTTLACVAADAAGDSSGSPKNVTCDYDGVHHAPGDTFPSTDGCNGCTCSQTGQVACTTVACVTPDDAGASDSGCTGPSTICECGTPTCEGTTWLCPMIQCPGDAATSLDGAASLDGRVDAEVTDSGCIGPRNVCECGTPTCEGTTWVCPVTQCQSDASASMDSGGSSDSGVEAGTCTPPGATCASPCPAGTYCLKQNGPTEFDLGCTPIPAACGGAPTCACMASCFCPSSGSNMCTAESNSLVCSNGAVSRREFKRDISYVTRDERAELANEALSTSLATYRYKNEPEGQKRHLGFIIDDKPTSSPAVAGDQTHVDEYGYTSMLLAAVQEQQEQIDALKRELEKIRAEEARRAGRGVRADHP